MVTKVKDMTADDERIEFEGFADEIVRLRVEKRERTPQEDAIGNQVSLAFIYGLTALAAAQSCACVPATPPIHNSGRMYFYTLPIIEPLPFGKFNRNSVR